MSDNLTPMMRQYREAKAAIPADAVLLFRLGDFYEEFFEDAERVSKTLELVLTRRQGVPMCGFPYHALESYLPRLVAAGLKVAIAEQMEDPRLAKGIVKRQVTRIITPGTITDQGMLDSGCNNFLVAVNGDQKGTLALAALDVSTGEFFICVADSTDQFAAELNRIGANELLISHKFRAFLAENGGLPEGVGQILLTELDDYEFDFAEAERTLLEHFGVATLDAFGCRDLPTAVGAAGAVMRYAVVNLRRDAGHITSLELRRLDNVLTLDAISLRNLELVSTRGSARGTTLFEVLDHTTGALGSRRLRQWVLRPLRDHASIVARQDAIDFLLLDQLTLAELRETTGGVRDLERITARLNLGSATPRDLQSLGVSLSLIPPIASLLAGFEMPMLHDIASRFGDFSELTDAIAKALVDSPPALLADGGVIRPGFSAELDELRSASTEGKNWLSEIQRREIERTGIKSLKVKFNNVFGYYIEISKSNLEHVPEDYVRKQTLVNAERFITPELKELENKILGAEEKARSLENSLFNQLREYAATFTNAIQRTADALADLDALMALAECARVNNYTRPRIFDDDRLIIKAGRHPVLDRAMPGQFVPNDCHLDGDRNRLMLITGPNMAGKSTYIRQTALLVIMAQMGSFIPAESAEIGLVDRIFTRVGAADDLARGQSTFMVEMVETANILRHATEKSLVILDEIGRGTSTFDGLSIAWSVAEYLHDDTRCRTQFATHYHELTELAQTRRGVNNYNVAVREYGDSVIFLRQIVPGASDRSYGIHVARLAGIPRPVLDRAGVILALLEKAADAPREAISALPRKTVRGKRKSDESDDMIQLRLL